MGAEIVLFCSVCMVPSTMWSGLMTRAPRCYSNDDDVWEFVWDGPLAIMKLTTGLAGAIEIVALVSSHLLPVLLCYDPSRTLTSYFKLIAP